MLTITIKSIKRIDYFIDYFNSLEIAIKMVFNKHICLLIYVNQNNGEKMNCLKRKFNVKNINIKN